MTEIAAEQQAAKPSRRRQVQAMLRHEDSTSIRGSLGRLFKGAGLCLLIGIVFVTVCVFASSAVSEHLVLTYKAWFGIYLVLLAGVIVLLYRRGNSNYLIASLSEPDDPVAATTRRSPILGALLWGPQSVVDGIAAMRGKWTARQNAMFLRAAEMVLELAKFDGGVEVRALMHPPEDMVVFGRVVDWLDNHDYIGKSADGERFWISTIAKNKMNAHGIKPREFKA